MQLSELADLVCGKVGKTDDASVAACKSYLRARHEMIVDSYPWKDTLDTFDVEVAAEATHAILPYEVARPWAVWDQDSGVEIPVGSLTNIIATNPAALSEVGGLLRFVEAASVGWLYPLAAAGSQLSFTSAGSVEITASINGEKNLNVFTFPDLTITETLVLGAYGGAATSSAFKVIHRMTKPSGTYVFVSQLSTSPVQSWVWPPDSTEATFARIRLIRPPTAAVTLGVLGKRKTRHLSEDSDAPMVRNIENALLAFAQADMLERSRQYAKAAAKVQEGTSLVEGARDLERNQSAKESRITPEVAAEEGMHWSQW